MTKPATRKASATKANADPMNTLKVTRESGTDEATMLAQTALRPSVRAAITTRTFASPQFGELDLTALVSELGSQIKLVNDGNLQRAEALLVAQAHTLDTIFHELARRASLNMGEYLGAAETYMRLALKTQSQCRATLETLAAIKNPSPVAFVKQANIAHGPQQVNNTPPLSPETSRARESENPPNKLLEQQRNDWLDTRAPQETVGADSAVEAVGEGHGTAHTGR